MICNKKTSVLIASKGGDKEELIKLATRLIGRMIDDIIPEISRAVTDSKLTTKEIESLLLTEMQELSRSKESIISKAYKSGEIIYDAIAADRGGYANEKQKEIVKIIELLDDMNIDRTQKILKEMNIK